MPLEMGICIGIYHDWLVVWNIRIIFPFSWEIVVPTDFHIFQDGSNHQADDITI